jgi:hypothetical protein
MGRVSVEKWIPCGEKFIVGDVIRWTEAIWLELKKKKKGKKKVEKLGARRVTGRGTERGCPRLRVLVGLRMRNRFQQTRPAADAVQEKTDHQKKAKHDREGKR